MGRKGKEGVTEGAEQRSGSRLRSLGNANEAKAVNGARPYLERAVKIIHTAEKPETKSRDYRAVRAGHMVRLLHSAGRTVGRCR